MSWQATQWALKQRFGSTPHRFVLVMLGNYAGHDGSTYVGQKRLASDTGMSERSVRRILGDLEKAGLISREERKRGSGAQSTDLITLNLPGEEEPDNLAGSPAEPDSVSGGTGQRDRGEPDSVSGRTNQRILTKESNQEESPSGDSRAPALPGLEKPAKQKGRLIGRPESWVPDLQRAVKELSISLADAEALRARFLSFHDARGSKFVKWDAAWLHWIQNEEKYDRSRKAPAKPRADGFTIMKA